MAFEQDNTARDFEAMLRRHLKHDAAAPAPCPGFDADAASAYVEGALGAASRARYEEHLAACPSCRQGVVELFHLVPQSSLPPIADTAPAREPWAGLRRWLDLSALARWPWAVAAAGLAGVLLFALLLPFMARRESQNAEVAQRNAEVAQKIEPSPAVQSAPSPVDEPKRQETEAREPARPQRQVARPSATPTAAGEAIAQDKVTGAVTVPNTSAIPRPPLPAAAPAELAQQGAPLLASPPPPPPAGEMAERREVSKMAGEKEPSPAVALRSSRESEANTASASVPRQSSRLVQLKPAPKEDAVTTRPPPWRAKSLARKVGDKTFYFERETWVDSEYSYDAKLPVVRLVRDSQEFERALAAQPALKQFFDLGQVRVVWQGKVYEVSK